ncbi:hypothetical protein B9Z19DRAFT_1124133 [Tuber borchii]|uniref:Uncharacterized protein n=1 Tax=Tuber borchii TaxID=42251 RepID=A0A2T6ZX54_TUBBO|nr:hypothetical protein B9Z19DRAFT_1124133 [Tuber borchii]
MPPHHLAMVLLGISQNARPNAIFREPTLTAGVGLPQPASHACLSNTLANMSSCKNRVKQAGGKKAREVTTQLLLRNSPRRVPGILKNTNSRSRPAHYSYGETNRFEPSFASPCSLFPIRQFCL